MTQRNGRRLWMLAALLAALGVVATTIGGDPREARAQGRADVVIVDGAYQPGSILVQAGDTVTWTNAGSTRHTVTADDGSADSSRLAPGTSFSHTFPTAGLFTYHCAIHPEMAGAVTITQAPDPAGGAPVHQVPRTGIGTTAPGQPLPVALLAMAAATVLGAGAVMGRRGPAAVAHWRVRRWRSPRCR